MFSRIKLTLTIFAVAIIFAGCATNSAPTQTVTVPEGNPPAGFIAGTGNVEKYVLNEGDKIAIQVFDEPDLTMDASVSANGNINYSYLGDIQVSGKTSVQLEQDITALLEDGYLVNPSVNVTIVQYRPFFINGEVRAPGSYPYQPGLTLDRAIALAGGLTDRASRSKMFIQKAANGTGDDADKANMQTRIAPGDIISIKEGFF